MSMCVQCGGDEIRHEMTVGGPVQVTPQCVHSVHVARSLAARFL